MADPTFKSGVGRLAVDRYDFQEHVDGYAFKHKAKGILTDPVYSQFDNATDLQGILDSLADFVDEQIAAGQGFVTFGDGLDTWHAADGNINYDNAIPALDTVLNPVLSAIYNNTSLAPEYERIRRGGIIFIKAGTYIVKDTIEVPPGITILGEGYGTKIVNAIRLDTTTLPPTRDLGTTAKPVFKILADTTRSVNDGAVDPNLFVFSRETKIMNLVICDNFVENTILGDVFYKLPTNITGDNPLIMQESGSSLQIHSVKLLGRVTYTSGTVVNEATRFAIQLDNTTGITTGTHLDIVGCFIDGFNQPIRFESIGGVNDYLTIKNSKIRSHGYLDGDDTTRLDNCIVLMNDNNINMIGNDLYGNHSLFDTVVYVLDALTAPLDVDARPHMHISGNNFVIDRGSNTNANPRWILQDSSLNATFYDNVALSVYGNNYSLADGFQLIAGESTMHIASGGSGIFSPGGINLNAQSGALGINAGTFAVSGTVGSFGLSGSLSASAPIYVNYVSNNDNSFAITGSGLLELAHAPNGTTAVPGDTNRSIIYFEGNELKSIHDDGTRNHYALDPTTCGLRLSGTSGDPIDSNNLAGALSTIYYTPYTSGYITLWDGTGWILRNTTEISASVTSLTHTKVYDVFAYWTGSAVALEFSNAWTNDTTRADALGTRNGIKVRSSNNTRRYIGTIRTINSGGTRTVNDGTQRLIWNQYNRLPRQMGNWSNDSTPYAPAGSVSWVEMGGGAYNMYIDYVCGESIYLEADSMVVTDCSITNSTYVSSIGIDTNTTNTIEFTDIGFFGTRTQTTTGLDQSYGNYKGYPSAGCHRIYWIIRSSGNVNFYFSASATNRYVKSGMTGVIMG